MIADCNATVRRCYEEQDDAMGVLHDLQSNVIEIGQLSSTADALKHIAEFVPGRPGNQGHVLQPREPGRAFERICRPRPDDGRIPGAAHVLHRGTAGDGEIFRAGGSGRLPRDPGDRRESRIGIFSVEMTGRQLAKRIAVQSR
jgi:hypothetical protein